MSYRERRNAWIEQEEGTVNHMYLDSRGNVTAGVGFHLTSERQAVSLPWGRRGQVATARQEMILRDYRAISEMKPGLPMATYAEACECELYRNSLIEILDRQLEHFERKLAQMFKGYGDMPDDARLGILDMAYSLGPSGLTRKFPKFCAAVKARDWQAAADQCHRKGPSEGRNQRVQRLFLSCV